MASAEGGTSREVPVLVYLYGPPAVGKLTVGRHLVRLTGFPLFHNHLSVDAVASVFPFGTGAFSDVLHRFRLDVFETTARMGRSMIFTNNSAWSGPDPRRHFAEFADTAADRVAAAGGRTFFVHLQASMATLEERLGEDDRRSLGKLVEVGRLRELLADLDLSPLHPSDLTLDTSQASPAEAAARITSAIQASS